MDREEDKIDFKDYFVVDPSSPTGLRWREDIYNHVENSIYLKHLKVSLTELLYHLENKLYNDNTLKIVE